MNYEQDARFADLFLCDGENDFHDYYYIDPFPFQENSVFYRVNRSGIESRSPRLLVVERGHHFPCCEIFCILSGSGTLTFRSNQYALHAHQLVVLPALEPHSYSSDPDTPLGTTWIEFYGSNATDLVRHIVERQGPVIEGPVYSEVSAKLTEIQQKLILGNTDHLSPELYDLVYLLLKNESRFDELHLSDNIRANFMRVEAYIRAHLSESLPNETLAHICGLSLPYFREQFRILYHTTPQRYIIRQRIQMSRNLLMQTDRSIDNISESLGFCNTSHFIRNFREQEGITPAKYRKRYKID